jgi:hypothetical protein
VSQSKFTVLKIMSRKSFGEFMEIFTKRFENFKIQSKFKLDLFPGFTFHLEKFGKFWSSRRIDSVFSKSKQFSLLEKIWKIENQFTGSSPLLQCGPSTHNLPRPTGLFLQQPCAHIAMSALSTMLRLAATSSTCRSSPVCAALSLRPPYPLHCLNIEAESSPPPPRCSSPHHQAPTIAIPPRAPLLPPQVVPSPKLAPSRGGPRRSPIAAIFLRHPLSARPREHLRLENTSPVTSDPAATSSRTPMSP